MDCFATHERDRGGPRKSLVPQKANVANFEDFHECQTPWVFDPTLLASSGIPETIAHVLIRR